MRETERYLIVRDLDLERLVRRLVNGKRAVTVVVTVFNGGPVLVGCFDSLLEHTPAGTSIVVIDDCSTDEETVDILDRYERDTRIEVVRHDKNRGYTRTANHGLHLSEPNDVVLLNSDTVVGPMWLQRLQWTAYYQDGVGTVSAVSNDAAANSIPRRHQRNDWYPRLRWDTTARLVAAGATVWSQDVPSAHGFCMYIRRKAISVVGPFDREAFPVGYGEEVDFSIRARQAGWRNVVAPHAMVKHLRSASFGKRRAALNASGKAVIAERYPDFRHDVAMWESSVGSSMVELSSDRVRTSWKGGDLGPLVARISRQQPEVLVLDRGQGAAEPFGETAAPRIEVPREPGTEPELALARLVVTRGVETLEGDPATVSRLAGALGLAHRPGRGRAAGATSRGAG